MRVRCAIVVGAWSAIVGCNALSGAEALSVAGVGDDGGAVPNTPPADENGGSVRSPAGPEGPAPTCSCAPAPPDGWKGPLALVAAEGSPVPRCPTGLVSEAELGLEPVTSSACSPCVCGSPTGTCNVTVQQFQYSTCTGSTCAATISTTCSKISFCGPTTYISSQSTPAASCAPSGGDLLPPSWTRSANACSFEAPPTVTCPAGELCAPKSAGAPDAKTCILHDGDVPCPSGPYSERTAYASQFEDARTCTACTCGTTALGCSGGTISISNDNTTECKNVAATQDVGGCHGFTTGDPYGSWQVTTSPTLTGTCTPSGGESQGSITARAFETVCCKP